MNEAVKPRPATVCTRCDTYSFNIETVNVGCNRMMSGKRCNGAHESALNVDDWMACQYCSGDGCGWCQQTGWRFVRYRRLESEHAVIG